MDKAGECINENKNTAEMQQSREVNVSVENQSLIKLQDLEKQLSVIGEEVRMKEILKSPSNTTIYVKAVKQKNGHYVQTLEGQSPELSRPVMTSDTDLDDSGETCESHNIDNGLNSIHTGQIQDSS